jgi:hypothetical protein
MVDRRPEVVTEVTLVRPGGVDTDLAAYDRVVVSGMYGYNDRELNKLAELNPIVWVHDTQFAGHWLLEGARHIILLTPQHLEFELNTNPLLRKDRVVLNPGWMDFKLSTSVPKKDYFALWAHRAMPHKGLDRAEQWAKMQHIRLEVMVGRPHVEVLLAMGKARYFVLLSHIFDPGPRAVMEAQLSHCELVVDNVGYWDEPPQELYGRLQRADKEFWDLVLNG